MDKEKKWVYHLLSKLFLDNKNVGEKVWKRFFTCYEERRRKREIRYSSKNKALAIAYSIHSVLCEEKISRPVKYILTLCGVPSNQEKNLLHVGRELGLNKKKVLYTDVLPEDLVHTACLHLEIPFAVAQQAERVLQNDIIKYGLYGRKPQCITAAVIEKVLQTKMLPSQIKALSEIMNCTIGTIKHIMKFIPLKLCTT